MKMYTFLLNLARGALLITRGMTHTCACSGWTHTLTHTLWCSPGEMYSQIFTHVCVCVCIGEGVCVCVLCVFYGKSVWQAGAKGSNRFLASREPVAYSTVYKYIQTDREWERGRKRERGSEGERDKE